MTKQEELAQKVHALDDNQLLDIWESTETMPNNLTVSTLRGFLMNELESRFPNAFDRWLDMDAPKDTDLRKIINTGK